MSQSRQVNNPDKAEPDEIETLKKKFKSEVKSFGRLFDKLMDDNANRVARDRVRESLEMEFEFSYGWIKEQGYELIAPKKETISSVQATIKAEIKFHEGIIDQHLDTTTKEEFERYLRRVQLGGEVVKELLQKMKSVKDKINSLHCSVAYQKLCSLEISLRTRVRNLSEEKDVVDYLSKVANAKKEYQGLDKHGESQFIRKYEVYMNRLSKEIEDTIKKHELIREKNERQQLKKEFKKELAALHQASKRLLNIVVPYQEVYEEKVHFPYVWSTVNGLYADVELEQAAAKVNSVENPENKSLLFVRYVILKEDDALSPLDLDKLNNEGIRHYLPRVKMANEAVQLYDQSLTAATQKVSLRHLATAGLELSACKEKLEKLRRNKTVEGYLKQIEELERSVSISGVNTHVKYGNNIVTWLSKHKDAIQNLEENEKAVSPEEESKQQEIFTLKSELAKNKEILIEKRNKLDVSTPFFLLTVEDQEASRLIKNAENGIIHINTLLQKSDASVVELKKLLGTTQGAIQSLDETINRRQKAKEEAEQKVKAKLEAKRLAQLAKAQKKELDKLKREFREAVNATDKIITDGLGNIGVSDLNGAIKANEILTNEFDCSFEWSELQGYRLTTVNPNKKTLREMLGKTLRQEVNALRNFEINSLTSATSKEIQVYLRRIRMANDTWDYLLWATGQEKSRVYYKYCKKAFEKLCGKENELKAIPDHDKSAKDAKNFLAKITNAEIVYNKLNDESSFKEINRFEIDILDVLLADISKFIAAYNFKKMKAEQQQAEEKLKQTQIVEKVNTESKSQNSDVIAPIVEKKVTTIEPKLTRELDLEPKIVIEPVLIAEQEPILVAEREANVVETIVVQQQQEEDVAPVNLENEEAEVQAQVERDRVEQERVQGEREELARVENEKAEKEQAEKIRIEKERLQQERAEKAQIEKEKAEKARAEQERVKQEKAEKARIKQEKAALDQEQKQQQKAKDDAEKALAKELNKFEEEQKRLSELEKQLPPSDISSQAVLARPSTVEAAAEARKEIVQSQKEMEAKIVEKTRGELEDKCERYNALATKVREINKDSQFKKDAEKIDKTLRTLLSSKVHLKDFNKQTPLSELRVEHFELEKSFTKKTLFGGVEQKPINDFAQDIEQSQQSLEQAIASMDTLLIAAHAEAKAKSKRKVVVSELLPQKLVSVVLPPKQVIEKETVKALEVQPVVNNPLKATVVSLVPEVPKSVKPALEKKKQGKSGNGSGKNKKSSSTHAVVKSRTHASMQPAIDTRFEKVNAEVFVLAVKKYAEELRGVVKLLSKHIGRFGIEELLSPEQQQGLSGLYTRLSKLEEAICCPTDRMMAICEVEQCTKNVLAMIEVHKNTGDFKSNWFRSWWFSVRQFFSSDKMFTSGNELYQGLCSMINNATLEARRANALSYVSNDPQLEKQLHQYQERRAKAVAADSGLNNQVPSKKVETVTPSKRHEQKRVEKPVEKALTQVLPKTQKSQSSVNGYDPGIFGSAERREYEQDKARKNAQGVKVQSQSQVVTR